MKKIRSRASVILLPVSLWLGHSFLAARLEVIQNRGISFGVNLPMTKIFLAIFLAILLGQVVKSFKWSIYLVFIGGLVNFTDRLLVGFVRDYFKVIFFYNNLADWVIFVGVTLYIFGFFYGKNRHSL